MNVRKRVIDIPATSCLLKQLRLEHGYSVSELQSRMKLESSVAIYAWESVRIKNIPSLENLDFLARLYGVHVEELYVMKEVELETVEVHEEASCYGIPVSDIMCDLYGDELEEFKRLVLPQCG